ncbi:MAG: hypothetical protein J7L94_16550 [Caldisericaceae bacterium]|nr:hypothetical protein [Caldisericaceae bacterium]
MKKVLIILSLATGLWAQGFEGVALGLGDNYATLSRGVHALNYNPANVALPRGNIFEFNLIGLNIGLFNNSFSLDTYNRFFVTDEEENRWSKSDRNEFLDLIPDAGLKLNSQITANAFGFAFNNFALAVQPVVVGQINTFKDKTLLDMGFFGDHVTKNYERNFDDVLQGSSFGAVKVSLAYAYPFLQIQKYLPDFPYLAVGIGVNYYISMAVAQIENSAAWVKRTQFDDYEVDEISVDMQAKTALSEGTSPVGKGRSFNFGLATQFKEKWQFSLSFIDLGGSVHYSEKTERHKINMYGKAIVYHPFDEDPETEDSSVDTTETIEPFDVDVPSKMRLGAAYQFKKNLVFTAEYVQGLDHSFGNSTTPRIGAGVFYMPLWWLPLRGGFSLGGNNGFIIALGSGIDLKYMTIDFSYAMKNALWPTHSEGLFTGISLMIKL